MKNKLCDKEKIDKKKEAKLVEAEKMFKTLMSMKDKLKAEFKKIKDGQDGA